MLSTLSRQALTLGLLLGLSSTGAQQAAPTPAELLAARGRTCTGTFDAATRTDAAFNATFRHECAVVRDVRMHYVVGGRGPALVLLHGWPQTWYEWKAIMPALAQNHTVIAVDLPGLGDSVGSPPSYEKRVLAQYVRDLISGVLGQRQIDLVGHDLGAGVAYQYAAQFPGEVRRLAYLDYYLPGRGTEVAQLNFPHFIFHRQEVVPEMLTRGREREYLGHFYPEVAGRPDAISEEEVDEFARTYSQPDKMKGGFELYRTLDEDERDNLAVAGTPLPMPVLVSSASIWPEGSVAATMRPVTRDLRAVTVPNSGHWLAEENPEFVTRALLDFFSEVGGRR
ncbi:epoxide hydrolase (plasmid) [Deinococcus aetherius]|uniref:Epoxide hydrolase n=1 Tax=Deinococcus aetherius TaxID=200252 RepID=A0ABN6RK53_9DEIO|nr:alpha/beta hydrolase [Deinococcus aetherius]BDP43678.1 epoxide hydrolase [Deinococcus aetherius]